MVRGRNNRITRTLGLALAACLTFATTVTSGEALAATSETSADATPAKASKSTGKHAKKRGSAKKAKVASSGSKPRKSTKTAPTLSASATHESSGSVVQAKHTAAKSSGKSAPTTTASAKKAPTTSAEKGKPAVTKKSSKGGAKDSAAPSRPGGTSKKASARAPGAKRKSDKKSASDSERPPCFAPAVSIDRNGLESETFSLVDCKGKPLESAREKLSILARPWGVARPTIEPKPKPKKTEKRSSGKSKPTELASVDIAPNVRLLDPGLLTRIGTIAKHFSGKHISLVSGYRPRSQGSLHQSARAIDLRVSGVSNEELVAFCKTLDDTGCGYYPNSSFVHVDVRASGTGSVTWIDASGPGEAPRYVSMWPPPPEPKAPDADTHEGGSPEGIEEEVLSDSARPAPSTSGKTNSETAADDSAAEPEKEAEPKDPAPVPKTDPPKEPAEAPALVRTPRMPAPHEG